MDHDADGTLDFISGSYDPGDLYFFRGLGKGKYARVETLLDETKTPLVHHPEELKKYERLRKDRASDDDETIHARVASFGSWPFPVDWDGDGAWDLVAGSSDGSVVWFRNMGSTTEPRFGAEQTLVEAKADSKFLSQYLEPGESPSPGVRAQICVVDYDRDGRLDLLVGDYSMLVAMRELDPEEEAELEEILRLQSEQGAALDSATDDAERAKIEAELKTLSAAKEQFLLPLATDAKRPPASFVWFFRREAIGPSGSGR